MKRLYLLGLAAALAAVAATPALAGELRIHIDGFRSDKGTILIGLYDTKATFDRAIELSDKDGFLNDPKRVAGVALRADAAIRGDVLFSNLGPGRYAVIVLHDENGNGRLDKNFWGVPTEPYGFSNDAQGFLGPPGYKDAAVSYDGANVGINISLVYHNQGIASLASPYGDDQGEGSSKPPVSPTAAATR